MTRKNIFSVRPVFAVMLALTLAAAMQWPSGNLMAQTTLRVPNVTSNASYSALSVKWTLGTVLNGAHGVSVTAGSAAVTGERANCAAPDFLSCNIVYANSSGTVAVVAGSSGIVTAHASGNNILAYVETSAAAITRIAYPQQVSTSLMPNMVLGNCGTSTSCASPTVKAGQAINVVIGTAAISGTSVTITNMFPAFTSSSTYGCTANSSATSGGLAANILSASSVIFTSIFGSLSGQVGYVCIGY